MSTLTSKTYFPPASSDTGIKEVSSFLDAYRAKNGADPMAQCFLSGPGEGEQVALPQDIYELLVTVIDALNKGMAVTIRPDTELVTTQQAADILGVSRPTVVRLVDNGVLPAEKIGRHRRLRLVDVLSHQKLRQEAQMHAIVATSDLDSESPSPEYFKEIRKRAAERHSKALPVDHHEYLYLT